MEDHQTKRNGGRMHYALGSASLRAKEPPACSINSVQDIFFEVYPFSATTDPSAVTCYNCLRFIARRYERNGVV